MGIGVPDHDEDKYQAERLVAEAYKESDEGQAKIKKVQGILKAQREALSAEMDGKRGADGIKNVPA